jgi:dephospho-CoA kinase
VFWLHIPFHAAGWLTRKVVEIVIKHKPIETKGKGRGKGGGKGRGKKKGDVAERVKDAALVAGKTTTDALAKRPGVQASLDSLKMKVTTGKPEKHEIIDEVYKNANDIIALLNSKGVRTKRLAVDGVPGSGKSTLSRALAEKLNFKLRTLDYIDLNKPQDFSKEKTIYEHHRLLRTQDIDNFDVIIYIDEPPELSQEKCLHRRRGGINIDIFDYEKLKKIGAEAFDIAAGRIYKIKNSYIKLKIKPKAGFRAYQNLRKKLKEKGCKTEGLSKEELLFVSVYGRPRKGLMAYVKAGAYNEELLEGLTAGMLRFLMA